jgi:hypothetical protein
MPEVTIPKETYKELRRTQSLTDYLASHDIYINGDVLKNTESVTNKDGSITFKQEAK